MAQYKVVPDFVGCLQCGYVGTKEKVDPIGRPVSSWWITQTDDPACNIGPFCSSRCGEQWAKVAG